LNIQQTTLYLAPNGQVPLAHIWPGNNTWEFSWLVKPEAIMLGAFSEPNTTIALDHQGNPWTNNDLISFLRSLPYHAVHHHQIARSGS